MKRTLAITFTAIFLSPVCAAAEKQALSDEQDKVNYSIGYQVGTDFSSQGVDVSRDALIRGMEDALSGAVPLLSEEERSELLVELKKRITAAEQQTEREQVEQRQREGQAFLAANAKQDGVKTTASGVQYRILREGTGPTPRATDTVTLHYRSTRIDGQEFDSSYRQGKPAQVRVDSLVPGLAASLQMMKEGARWQIVLPPEQAYGRRGPMAYATVIVDLELISID